MSVYAKAGAYIDLHVCIIIMDCLMALVCIVASKKAKKTHWIDWEIELYIWRKMANARDGKLYAGIVCFGSIVNTMWTFCYWFMLLSNQLSLHYLKYVLYYKPKRNGGIFTGARYSISKKELELPTSPNSLQNVS